MKLTQLFDDDRAVSPVIGVILMVAITVILAAVIGTFVLGLGDQVQTTTPSASFQTDYTNATTDNVTITHGGGDTISGSELYIKSSGTFVSTGGASGTSATWDAASTSSGDVAAGSSVKIYNSDMSDYTIRVVWQTAEGDNSAQLAKWEGPEA